LALDKQFENTIKQIENTIAPEDRTPTAVSRKKTPRRIPPVLRAIEWVVLNGKAAKMRDARHRIV
jgi:hypothetical protein